LIVSIMQNLWAFDFFRTEPPLHGLKEGTEGYIGHLEGGVPAIRTSFEPIFIELKRRTCCFGPRQKSQEIGSHTLDLIWYTQKKGP